MTFPGNGHATSGCASILCRVAQGRVLTGVTTAAHPTCFWLSHAWRRLSLRPALTERLLQGCSKIASPSTSPPGVHSRTPHRVTLPGPRVAASTSLPPLSEEPSVHRRHAGDMFRLRRFSLPCRIAPPGGSWACCIPQPTMRFTGLPPRRAGCAYAAFPPVPRPPELSPPAKPCLRHRWPLPSCRYRLLPGSPGDDATSGLCSLRASVVARPRCRWR